RGMNSGEGFFSKNNRASAGTTATIVIYTKKSFEKSRIPQKTFSFQINGAMDATSFPASTISNQ
ncbi:hypothetical protein ACUOIJ_23735, partial [Escherichia coli]